MKRSLHVPVGVLLAHVALAAAAPEPSAKGWNNPEDPHKDCKIQREGNALSIEMPGTDHDYDPLRKQLNAPHILREIQGNFELQVRIRIDCPLAAQSTVKGRHPCVSAGFVMIFPDRYPHRSFCRRLDYGIVQQRIGIDDFAVKPLLPHPQIEKETRKGIGEDGCVLYKDWIFGVKISDNREVTIERERLQQSRPRIWDRGWRDWPIPKKADCVYLGIEQWDKGIAFFLSPDGEKWIRVTSCIPPLPAKSKVGLAAYTTSPEPSKVRFDQIKFSQGTEKTRMQTMFAEPVMRR